MAASIERRHYLDPANFNHSDAALVDVLTLVSCLSDFCQRPHHVILDALGTNTTL